MGSACGPTAESDYSVKSSPWRNGKGDLVAEVAAAARKHGMQFGVYLSPWDRHEPRYKDSAAYDDYYESQLGELASRYGQLTEFWLDGAGSGGHVYDFPRFVEKLRIYQPNTLVFADVALFDYGDIRWSATKMDSFHTSIGTSSTATARCAGGRAKPTRRCAKGIGSAGLMTKPPSRALLS